MIIPHRGISFLIRVHKDHGPRIAENYIIAKQLKHDQLTCVISVIAENKPHANHETHLRTTKVVTILILSVHVLCQERLGSWPTIWGGPTKKTKNACSFRV